MNSFANAIDLGTVEGVKILDENFVFTTITDEECSYATVINLNNTAKKSYKS